MGIGRIFSRGGVGDFPKFFPAGGQKWWNLVFTPRNWKNNLYLLIISKSRGAKAPPTPLPTPMPRRYRQWTSCCYKRLNLQNLIFLNTIKRFSKLQIKKAGEMFFVKNKRHKNPVEIKKRGLRCWRSACRNFSFSVVLVKSFSTKMFLHIPRITPVTILGTYQGSLFTRRLRELVCSQSTMRARLTVCAFITAKPSDSYPSDTYYTI